MKEATQLKILKKCWNNLAHSGRQCWNNFEFTTFLENTTKIYLDAEKNFMEQTQLALLGKITQFDSMKAQTKLNLNDGNTVWLGSVSYTFHIYLYILYWRWFPSRATTHCKHRYSTQRSMWLEPQFCKLWLYILIQQRLEGMSPNLVYQATRSLHGKFSLSLCCQY